MAIFSFGPQKGKFLFYLFNFKRAYAIRSIYLSIFYSTYNMDLQCQSAAVLSGGCSLDVSQFFFNVSLKVYQPMATLADPTCVLTGQTPSRGMSAYSTFANPLTDE